MKKFISVISCLTIAIFATSCSDSNEETTNYIVESSSVEVLEDTTYPNNVQFVINGDVLEIKWDEMDNATLYEVRVFNNREGAEHIYDTTDLQVFIGGVEQGDIGDISVRSIYENELSTDPVFSDWVDGIFEAPVLDYSAIDYADAVFLSEEKLLEWINYYGYTRSIEEISGGITAITCFYRDPLITNDSANTVLTVTDGTGNELDDSATDDILSVSRVLYSFISEKMDVQTRERNIIQALNETISGHNPNNVVLTYYFDSDHPERSSIAANAIFPASGRETPENVMPSYHMTQQDGIYRVGDYSQRWQREIYAQSSKVNDNGVDKCIVAISPEG